MVFEPRDGKLVRRPDRLAVEEFIAARARAVAEKV